MPCSRMAVWRTLRKLRITRKKKVLYAQEQQKPEVQQQRLEFATGMTVLCPERLIFVDEGGTNTAMARLYPGRGAPSHPASARNRTTTYPCPLVGPG